MRSVKFLVAAGAVTLLSSAAFAADMPRSCRPAALLRAAAEISVVGICAAISA